MSKIGSEPLIPVRDKFDQDKVKAYLLEHLDVPNAPMEVQQYNTGSSNLTYLITMGDWEAVLRRPPYGPLPPKAHDMKRESSLLTKLYPEFNIVPKPYIFCEDESIMGAPFYVMERKTGIILDRSFPEGITPTDETGKDISEAFIDTLVKLHDVDYKKAGLESFGYPEGFLERQVNSWIKRYLRTKTQESPVFEKVAKWMADEMPKSKYVSIIHNDYKLNNTLLSSDLKKVNAVFDWEMATVADPLFDLGITLGYWIEEDDPDYIKNSLLSVTHLPGFYNRREFIHAYAQKTGRDVDDVHYYIIFAFFKLAGVFQQIFTRYKMGQASNDRFATYDQRAQDVLLYANELIESKKFNF
ncbi:phosphotransferase family protein [Bacillus dakarensis]|uniref:phosphotransferase family protein n=1 Tax=Robertmurraya dakarensis TaxID=1926278 RepID=UPI000980CA33|nr:phosphotransferase family protein [Bacillus dakarensis]